MDNNPKKIEPVEKNQNTYFYKAKVVPVFDEDQFIVKIPDEHVNVTIRGKEELINKIRDGEDIDKSKFIVDLINQKPGIFDAPITYTGFPEGVEIDVNPKTVLVNMEAKYREEFEVTVDKLGLEADGYQSGEPIVRPKKVHISGTMEQIDKVAFVKAFINIDDAKAPILQQVPLRALDKNGNVIELEIIPQIVEVQIPVTSPYTTVPITFKLDKYPKEGYAIKSLNQITKLVTLYGPKDVIDKYTVYNGPSLDLSDITEDKIIKLEIPLEKGLLKTEPDIIQFEVTIAEAKTTTFSSVPIEINGLPENLMAEIISHPDGLTLTLEGAGEVLNTLNIEDLQAFIDLTNLPPGNHEVPVQYNVPLLTKRISEKETVTVIIKE